MTELELSYLEGTIAKCAELGIDPEKFLMKLAENVGQLIPGHTKAVDMPDADISEAEQDITNNKKGTKKMDYKKAEVPELILALQKLAQEKPEEKEDKPKKKEGPFRKAYRGAGKGALGGATWGGTLGALGGSLAMGGALSASDEKIKMEDILAALKFVGGTTGAGALGGAALGAPIGAITRSAVR